MVRICFVCLGNICRSPTAEAVMRHLVDAAGLSSAISIESAGMGDWHVGSRADERAITAGHRRGYRLDGRAQQWKAAFFERFDYVIAMDRSNKRSLDGLVHSARRHATE